MIGSIAVLKLSNSEAAVLLGVARSTLEETTHAIPLEVVKNKLAQPVQPPYNELCACFITLEIQHHLRGCMGTLEARLPLLEEVMESTYNAAFYDPRFRPVTAEEVPQIEIEVSLLTPPQGLAYESPADLLGKLTPFTDGVILMGGGRRATFLPQVWEKIPEPADFLSAICRKMGFPPDHWQKFRFEVAIYHAIPYWERDF